jgi:hypothetical protein
MQPIEQQAPVSKSRLWTGRVVSGLTAALLLLDGALKALKLPAVVAATVKVGFPESAVAGIGCALLVSTLLYLIPRTSILGAILLTGYLGGAVATHVRLGDPLFSHVLAPVYLAVFVWGGLCLRDKWLQALIFSRS